MARSERIGHSLAVALIVSMGAPAHAEEPSAHQKKMEQLAEQKALAEAEKEAANAKTAQIAAETEALKAKIGVIEGQTGITGAVTAGTNAGKAEASVLLVKELTEVLTKVLTTDSGLTLEICKPQLVLFAGQSTAAFPTLRRFRYTISQFKRGFESADALLKEADVLNALSTAPSKEAIAAQQSGIAGVGIAVEAAAKLGSLFLTDYKIDDLTVATTNEVLLSAAASAIRQRCVDPKTKTTITTITLPQQMTGFNPDRAVTLVEFEQGKLNSQRINARTGIARADEQARALRKAGGEQQLRTAAAYEAAAAAYRSLLAADAKLFEDLTLQTNVAVMDALLDELALLDKMSQADARALVIDLSGSGGSSYSRKSLWTFLGGMPYFVSTAGTLSWALFEKDGKLNNSGVKPFHGGFHRVTRVETEINEPK